MVRNARPGEGQAGVRVERRVRADLRNDRVQRLRDRRELGPVVGALGRPLGAVLLVLRMHPLVRDEVLGTARAHRLATQRAEQLAVRTLFRRPPGDLLDEALAVLLGDVQARLADREVVPSRVPLAAALDHVLLGKRVQRTKLWLGGFGEGDGRTQHGHQALRVLQVGY